MSEQDRGDRGIFAQLSALIRRRGPILPTDTALEGRLERFLRPRTPEEIKASLARANAARAAKRNSR